MSAFWYYAEGTETIGPVTFDELIKMLSRLSNARGVLVWREGFDDWKAAETVREIVEKLFRPPPLAPRPPPRPSVQLDPLPADLVHEAKQPQPTRSNEKVGPIPLGGWLVYLGIGQGIGCIALVISYLIYYAKVIEGNWFEKLPVAMWLETAINVAMFALAIWTTILLWNESKKFPRFFIYQCVVAILMTPI
jgi:hypothetical protein